MIRAWHSDLPNVGEMAFRGGAKSTRAEEAVAIQAWFGDFHNCVILGESEARAVDRLRSIKNAFETNEYAQWLFEVGPGDIWAETKITLNNGRIIQAYGRGQSLRGVKHLDARPDLVFMDDLEDKESVATPEAREKTLVWFTSTVMPALDPKGRMRMAATPLHPEALAVKLSEASSWTFLKHPIIYRDLQGEWAATWPARFPVAAALKIQSDMSELGKGEEFDQEYMCQARNPATQTFTPDTIKIVPRARSWHPTFAMYDPARTTNKGAATTGKVVWSWIGRKLVIWAASAKKWLPNETINDMFEVDRDYSPIAIGFEEDGLNEWGLQPIRTEQVARGVILPLRPLKAPKGKLDFIRGLQPYFRAGEVEFACDLPELRDQLLGFPTGAIDAPNALAYALKMKLGVPVYENLQADHVVAEAKPSRGSPVWLAVNTDGRVTTAVLCQLRQGVLTIFADWLADGSPLQTLPDIFQEASLETPVVSGSPGGKAQLAGASRLTLRLVAPTVHFNAYDTIGLRAAVRRLPAELTRGGDIVQGREELSAFMGRQAHGAPALRICERARWTLRAISGGYARDVGQAEPTAGAYRVVMEGLESFAGLTRGVGLADDTPRNISYTPDGRPYTSALARTQHG